MEYRVNALDLLQRMCDRNTKYVTVRKKGSPKPISLTPADVDRISQILVAACNDRCVRVCIFLSLRRR